MVKRTNHPIFVKDDFEDFEDADDEIDRRTHGGIKQSIPDFIDFVSGLSKKNLDEDENDE